MHSLHDYELRVVVEPHVSGDEPDAVVIYIPGVDEDPERHREPPRDVQAARLSDRTALDARGSLAASSAASGVAVRDSSARTSLIPGSRSGRGPISGTVTGP